MCRGSGTSVGLLRITGIYPTSYLGQQILAAARSIVVGPMSINIGIPVMHRIDNVVLQQKERYTGKPASGVHGVKRTTITRRKVDRAGRTSESPKDPSIGTALKLPSPLSISSFTWRGYAL